MDNYQFNYAAGRPQMYYKQTRERKALRIIKMLENFLGKEILKKLSVLDIGSSTGIIDNFLAKRFKKVTGIDIDKEAVSFAKKRFKRKNLEFYINDAMNLSFKNDKFDIVICTQVYEHVPNAKKLFSEIYRVLKPGGICYLAATNRLWPWEPHYDLPFLSWLPKMAANFYVRLAGKADKYYESPKSYWGLQKLTQKFEISEFTQEILKKPKEFGFEDKIKGSLVPISWTLAPLAKYLAPTFFWLLIKEVK
jgi:ubiquinone/menaquinone biosynthesis C-methylase UbiE